MVTGLEKGNSEMDAPWGAGERWRHEERWTGEARELSRGLRKQSLGGEHQETQRSPPGPELPHPHRDPELCFPLSGQRLLLPPPPPTLQGDSVSLLRS